MAAIEMEKRLVTLEADSTANDDNTNSSSSSSSRIGDISITPETEGILKSIFRTLDPTDSGLVPISSIIQVLGLEISSSSSSSSSSSLQQQQVINILCKTMGSKLWLHFKANLISIAKNDKDG